MPKIDAFTTRQLTKKLRIHPQTFEGWLRKAILRPRIYSPSGKGTTRLFNLHNLFEASLIKRLARDRYPLNFIAAVLGIIEERQLIQKFLDQVSKGVETESQFFLRWAGDLVGQPSSMEFFELGESETDLAIGFEKFERTLVLNLSLLFNRICVELEELGVKI